MESIQFFRQQKRRGIYQCEACGVFLMLAILSFCFMQHSFCSLSLYGIGNLDVAYSPLSEYQCFPVSIRTYMAVLEIKWQLVWYSVA